MKYYIKGNYRRSIFSSEKGYVIGIFKVRETNDERLKDYVNKTITFTIYGEETRDPDRTIAFTSTTVSTTPPTTQIVADAGQPIGYIVATNGNTGVVAELYKHIYVDGVEQEVTKVNKTTYRMFPRTITVGVAGDETLSNELQAAIATQDEALVNATLASCLERMQ